MNREEALKIVERLIINESKVLFTALCHMEEMQFESISTQLIKEGEEYSELFKYLQENLK